MMKLTKVKFRKNWVVPHEDVLEKEAATDTRFNGCEVDRGTLYIEKTKLTWMRDRDGRGISIDRDLIDSYKFGNDFSYKCILDINMKARVIVRDYSWEEEFRKISFNFADDVMHRMSNAMKQLLPSLPALSANVSEVEDRAYYEWLDAHAYP